MAQAVRVPEDIYWGEAGLGMFRSNIYSGSRGFYTPHNYSIMYNEVSILCDDDEYVI